MVTLDSLAILYGSDKSSMVHNLCFKYEKYFPFNREDKIKILEIGVLDGSSLRMWKKYYSNSIIVGFDIDKRCEDFSEERIYVEVGSQTDSIFLKKIIEKYGPFDMILDDGSHYNSDVIFSFENLFSSLNVGGIYVIEDCVTSYWPTYGGGDSDSTMNYFKKLTDDVNYRGMIVNGGYHRKDEPLMIEAKKVIPDCRLDIESINFLNNIIIITKK